MPQRPTARSTTIDIQDIEERTSASGNRFWRVLTSDDETMYVWDRTLVDQLRPGRNHVRVERGKYPRITAVDGSDAASTSTRSEPRAITQQQQLDDHIIARAAAAVAASYLMHATGPRETDDPVGHLLEIATTIATWITNSYKEGGI